MILWTNTTTHWRDPVLELVDNGDCASFNMSVDIYTDKIHLTKKDVQDLIRLLTACLPNYEEGSDD